MVKDYRSVYESHATNAEIAAGGTAFETFFSSNDDRSNMMKHNQSFNAIDIVNDSALTLYIDLDGLTSRRRILFGKTAFSIKPEEGIYFNNVKITNTDAATAVAATLLQLNARIMLPE